MRSVGEKVRCPDALITCTKFPESERLALNVVVVFEVLSTDSGSRDRIEKLREYAAVPAIRRYVILEYCTTGLLVLHRAQGDDPWTAESLTANDILPIPEVGIAVPVSEPYEDVDVPETEDDGT
jgi:Uma2 family endonuclease